MATPTQYQAVGRRKTSVARVYLRPGTGNVVINAEKVRFTGKKETDKEYFRHSNYPGGVTIQSPREVRAKHPERLVEHAVKGMLPKNALGRQMIKKLKVYAGPEHPHTAQQPETLEV